MDLVLDKTFWCQYALALLPVAIFLGYPIFLYTAVEPADNLLWNIYIFFGMPTHAAPIGSTYKWWNLIYVGADTIKRIFFYFPLGGVALVGLVWYNYKNSSAVAYVMLILVEFIVLFITFSQ